MRLWMVVFELVDVRYFTLDDIRCGWSCVRLCLFFIVGGCRRPGMIYTLIVHGGGDSKTAHYHRAIRIRGSREINGQTGQNAEQQSM